MEQTVKHTLSGCFERNGHDKQSDKNDYKDEDDDENGDYTIRTGRDEGRGR